MRLLAPVHVSAKQQRYSGARRRRGQASAPRRPAAWLVAFVLVKRGGDAAADVAGCGASYWPAANRCGVDGADCRPFDGAGFAFRCPANCLSYLALNPRAVGDQEVVYRPLVGGPPDADAAADAAIYRGDSYMCAAAIHAGLVSNGHGGCGVALAGRHQGFVASRRNGVASVSFDSYFPLSYRFVPGVACASADPRWALLAISLAFTVLASLLTVRPAFFFPAFVVVFWTVGSAFDPPPHATLAALFSNVVGKVLPAMFVAWAMYDRMGVGRALAGLAAAPVERAVLWLGACWVGALSNYTLDFIPIQRLNKHDLDQQPGAKAALAVIVVVLVAIFAAQAYFLRNEGRLPRLLGLYALLLAAIVVALALPAQNLRLHHYVVALLLLPGIGLQTRPSLLYQGLLVGLFINDVARWGFDPVLQTSLALQGEAHKGTLLPAVRAPAVPLGDARSTITFGWDAPPDDGPYDGLSVLVNDVERFRTYFGDADHEDRFVWTRNRSLGLPEYFRFAFMSGSDSGDYTRAGTWTADGRWLHMAPGPSKLRLARRA